MTNPPTDPLEKETRPRKHALVTFREGSKPLSLVDHEARRAIAKREPFFPSCFSKAKKKKKTIYGIIAGGRRGSAASSDRMHRFCEGNMCAGERAGVV